MGEDYILNIIKRDYNDYEVLILGTKVIEDARDRLDSDLDNAKIRAEYYKLDMIVNELKNIIENYV